MDGCFENARLSVGNGLRVCGKDEEEMFKTAVYGSGKDLVVGKRCTV